ncbi:MAG: hypothetical protein FJW34_01425 [Acidobacteria bacterium]|nr:hypothetical protein [Acidobacteriota bacterium]
MSVLPAVGLFLLVAFAAVNLPLTFDESFNITVPRNLVSKGVYGTATIRGVVPFDPAISTGPTVLLPVAVSQRIGGIGLLQSRVVAVLFFGLFLAVMISVLRATPSPMVAVAVGISALVPFRAFEEAARILGEFPAFALVGLAAFGLHRSLVSDRPLNYLATGALVSLAVLAKPIVFPIALSAFATIALHHMAGRQPRSISRIAVAWILFGLPLIVPVLFWAILPRLLHPEYFLARALLMTQHTLFAGQPTPLAQILPRLSSLPSPLLAFLMPVAVVIGLFRALWQRNPSAMFMALTCMGFLGWWLWMAPIPDRRFALYWAWIGAVMLGDLSARIVNSVLETGRPIRTGRLRACLKLAVVAAAALVSVIGLAKQCSQVAAQRPYLEAQRAVVRFASWAASGRDAIRTHIYGYQWYMPWFVPALSAIDVGEFERDWLWSGDGHSAYLVEVPEIKGHGFVQSLVRLAVSQYGSEPSAVGPYTIHRILSSRWTDHLLTCEVEQDLLSQLRSNKVISLPSRLEDPKGRFRYPITLGWNIGREEGLNIRPLRPAIAMITEAELRLRGVAWKSDSKLLLGVLRPPEHSDGFTMRASVLPAGKAQVELGKFVFTREMYRRDDPFFYVLFPALPRYSEGAVLRLELLPEPGGGAADWAFLSPLVLVRAPGISGAEHCLRR